jgi:hypothetical protein
MQISKFSAQKTLAILWFINSGVLILLFVAFTAFDRFDGKPAKGWEWITQNIFPTLTLMISAFTISAGQQQSDLTVDRFYFRLAFGVSLFYLGILYLTIFLAPLAFSYSNLSILDLFAQSNIYLALLQGVVTGSIGLFFAKK